MIEQNYSYSRLPKHYARHYLYPLRGNCDKCRPVISEERRKNIEQQHTDHNGCLCGADGWTK